jgi:AAA+ superfamily predicted ATPase
MVVKINDSKVLLKLDDEYIAQLQESASNQGVSLEKILENYLTEGLHYDLANQNHRKKLLSQDLKEQIERVEKTKNSSGKKLMMKVLKEALENPLAYYEKTGRNFDRLSVKAFEREDHELSNLV